MNKIALPTYLINEKEYLIVAAADIESEHDLLLDSNSLLEQLQIDIKAVKFWCGDNEIIKNGTPQVFPPSHQACQWKGELAWNAIKKLRTGLVMYQSWAPTVPIRVILG